MLCFNCDRKYSKGHKCNENKLCYIDCEEEEPNEEEASQEKAIFRRTTKMGNKYVGI